MYVEVTSNNGTEYLRLVRSQRVTNAKGVKTVTKVVVRNLGPLSRFHDGGPDYVARLKQSFKDGTPIIPELLPYINESAQKQYKITFTENDDACIGSPKRFAPCVLDPVFSALGLDSCFAGIKHSSGIKYDLQGIVRLLTYGRILDPASKISTARQNSSYYIPLAAMENENNVYDALDLIYISRRKIIQRMNTCISKGIGRGGSTVFYDVTNFFFEIAEPDPDTFDSDGNIVEKGLRKMGVSKENRKQPIVQMGLFLDENGIPISIEVFPGNILDHQTLRTAMRSTVDTLKLNRFILIADRGMYSGTNMCHVLNQGDGYIVSKSLKKSTKKDREWTLNPDGYTEKSADFKYKSRIVTRSITDENGTEKKVREKVVVYWSRVFYERERHENQSFLDFVEKLKKNPNGFRVTAAQSRSLRKFLKKELVDKDTGEILDGRKLLAMIDDDKLTEYRDLMGYYQIVSSELDMPDLEIIDKYHGLTRIEDQFREMKGTLDTRPVYVRTPEHIYAHFIICFIALTMMRVIQYRIKAALPPAGDAEQNWSYGLSGKRVANALAGWQIDRLPGDYYRMLITCKDDLDTILQGFNISIPKKIFTRGDLRALKSSFRIFQM